MADDSSYPPLDPTAAVAAELGTLRIQILAIEKAIDKLSNYPTEVDKAVANVKSQLEERIKAIELRAEATIELVPLFHNSLTEIEVTKRDIGLLRSEIKDRAAAQKEALSLALASIEKATIISQQTADRAVAKAEAAASQALLEQMIAAVRNNFGDQIASLKESLVQAMSSAKEAVTKAEVANEKRFEGFGEFRTQMAEQAQRFMPRTETETMIKAINDKVGVLSSRFDKTEGHSSGMSATAAIATGAIGLVATIIMVTIAILAFNK